MFVILNKAGTHMFFDLWHARLAASAASSAMLLHHVCMHSQLKTFQSATYAVATTSGS